jgi:hypothetical protein
MTANMMKLHGLRMRVSRGRFMRASIASFGSGWNETLQEEKKTDESLTPLAEAAINLAAAA